MQSWFCVPAAQGRICVHRQKRTCFVPQERVKAVDTTGAGDAFIGSFLGIISTETV